MNSLNPLPVNLIFPQGPIDRNGNTSLHVFAAMGMVKQLEQALEGGYNKEAKNSNGNTPLLAAVNASQYKCVKLLLNSNVDITHKNLLAYAVKVRSLPIVNLLINRHVQVVPEGCIDPLFLAISKLKGRNKEEDLSGGDLELVKTLIHAGANPHAISNDGSNESLLFRLAEDQFDIACFLLDPPYCLNPNLQTNHEFFSTPLFHALSFSLDSCKIVKKLLKMGAKPDNKNNAGQTPLCFSIDSGFFKAAILLLNWGANPNLKNDEKNTPFDSLVDFIHREGNEFLGEEDVVDIHNLMIILLDKGANLQREDYGNILSFLIFYPSAEVSKRWEIHLRKQNRNVNSSYRRIDF